MPHSRVWPALLVGASLVACAASRPRGGSPNVDVPAYSESYSTDRGSDGVRGGGAASDAEELVQVRLKQRGQDVEAEPDGRLADAAAWLLRRAYSNDAPPSDALGVAHRFGYAGILLGYVASPVEGGRLASQLDQLTAQIPRNVVVNRYGIVAGQGSDVALVLGSVEASLEEFPRSVAPGGKLRLEGSVSKRYQKATIFATDPRGKVSELPMPGRTIDASVGFPNPGSYKLEVMGYGASGPVVLVNVPIHVGVGEELTESTDEGDPNLTVEEAEATLLALLNEERAKHGASPVAFDTELRSVALAHSKDMLDHGFFGHVSPNTGTPDDRVRRARIRISRSGECLALETTPARAHRGLLDSPAHRSAMIDPWFTHAGFGVSFDDTGPRRRLTVTLLMGRRVPPEEARKSAAELASAIHAQRAARKLPPVRVDPSLGAVAGAGSRALTSDPRGRPERALAASNSALRALVDRTRRSRSVCHSYIEIIETAQLTEVPLLKEATLSALGIAVAELDDGIGPVLGVVLAGEAAPKRQLRCQ